MKLVFATVVICLSFIHLITVKHLYFQHRSFASNCSLTALMYNESWPTSSASKCRVMYCICIIYIEWGHEWKYTLTVEMCVCVRRRRRWWWWILCENKMMKGILLIRSYVCHWFLSFPRQNVSLHYKCHGVVNSTGRLYAVEPKSPLYSKVDTHADFISVRLKRRISVEFTVCHLTRFIPIPWPMLIAQASSSWGKIRFCSFATSEEKWKSYLSCTKWRMRRKSQRLCKNFKYHVQIDIGFHRKHFNALHSVQMNMQLNEKWMGAMNMQ